jgi:hypothetical protein
LPDGGDVQRPLDAVELGLEIPLPLEGAVPLASNARDARLGLLEVALRLVDGDEGAVHLLGCHAIPTTGPSYHSSDVRTV